MGPKGLIKTHDITNLSQSRHHHLFRPNYMAALHFMSKAIPECTALVKLRCWLSRHQVSLLGFRINSYVIWSEVHSTYCIFVHLGVNSADEILKTCLATELQWIESLDCERQYVKSNAVCSHWLLWAWDKQRDICLDLKLRFCCSAHAVVLRTGRVAMHFLRVVPVPAASSLPVLGL